MIEKNNLCHLWEKGIETNMSPKKKAHSRNRKGTGGLGKGEIKECAEGEYFGAGLRKSRKNCSPGPWGVLLRQAGIKVGGKKSQKKPIKGTPTRKRSTRRQITGEPQFCHKNDPKRPGGGVAWRGVIRLEPKLRWGGLLAQAPPRKLVSRETVPKRGHKLLCSNGGTVERGWGGEEGGQGSGVFALGNREKGKKGGEVGLTVVEHHPSAQVLEKERGKKVGGGKSGGEGGRNHQGAAAFGLWRAPETLGFALGGTQPERARISAKLR